MAGSDPNVTDDTWLEHMRLVGISLRALEEAQGAYRATLKKAKAAGVPTKALIDGIRARGKDETVVKMELRDYVRGLNLARVPVKVEDVFNGWKQPEIPQHIFAEDVEERGYYSGRNNGLRENNPHKAGSEDHQVWDRGWRKGQESLAVELGENAKAGNPTRERPKRAEGNDPRPEPKRRTGAGKKGAASPIDWSAEDEKPVVN